MSGEGPPRLSPFALSRFVHREIIVLVILTGAAIAAFLVTKASADAAHRLRVRDAETWYGRGVASLAAGRVDDALTALGRARALDRDTAEHHLSFASALIASDQHVAARQVLLGLRQAHPENPQVNLGLAELAATRASVEEAVSYYQRALYGDWPAGRLEDRERVRVSLIQYLIAHGMRERASGQLLLLAADLPAETGRQLETAGLLLAAGEPARALGLFTRVLAREPANAAALEGAGDAAFALGDYAAARGYYADAPDGPRIAERLRMATLVLASDPLAPRLSAAERRRRLTAGHARATALLAACEPRVASDDDAAEQRHALAEALAALGEPLQTQRARRPLDAGTIADGVTVIAGAVSFASTRCAPLEPEARAWLLIRRDQEPPR